MTTKKCPCGKGDMHLTTRQKKACVHGVDVNVESEAYVCPRCGIEAGTVIQASHAQRAVSDAYRKKQGLLTGEEIQKLRKERGLDRQQLADLMDVCAESIRKWEEGLIQDHVIDRSLRKILC
jgi:putative zinc finger/helix-turn-helix YgiT family protein